MTRKSDGLKMTVALQEYFANCRFHCEPKGLEKNMSNVLSPTSPGSQEQKPSAAAIDQYGRQLYKYSAEVQDPHFLEYRHLQQINLTELQNELASQKAAFSQARTITAKELETLRTTLHLYGKAVCTLC